MNRSNLLAAAALATLLISPAVTQTRELTFRDRVEAQRAIERFYYSHQTEARLPFDQAVSTELLERKVRTAQKQSAALEKYWNTPVTAEMLDAEIERMRRATRMPARLSELFSALGHNRLLIRECLARPVLVGRLLESFYASDQRFHAGERRRAEEIRRLLEAGRGARSDIPAPDLIEIRVGDSEPKSGSGPGVSESSGVGSRLLKVSEEELHHWRRRLPSRVGEVGTISEEEDRFTILVLREERIDGLDIAVYAVPKRSRETWWREVEGDLDESEVPTAALESSSVPDPETVCPADDVWDASHLNSGALVARESFTAVWTGSRMIVWGGLVTGSPNDTVTAGSPRNTGDAYDPATDTWVPTSLTGAPTPRAGHVAVWTGSRMLIWGGDGGQGKLNTGAAYDPVAGQWSPMTTSSAPEARAAATAVWTGNRMLVWGGYNQNGLSTGGRYDPVTNTWTGMSVTNAPSPRSSHTAVWTGSRMIIWGGYSVTGYTNDGGVYDPVADTWIATSLAGAPPARRAHTAVWSGNLMIVWGGDSTGGPAPGGRYDPVSNQWTAVTLASAPEARFDHSAVWIGSSMLIWGGRSWGNQIPLSTGGRYFPGSNSWVPISTVNAPLPRGSHRAVWTGVDMLVWGGDQQNSGGRYNLASDSWTPTNSGNVPGQRKYHSAIWTGNKMVIWGGGPRGGVSNTGGVYDPMIDDWTPTSLSGAPGPRYYHSAVWTGNRMVIWGGLSFWPTIYNDGALYDPVADSWEPTSPVDAPTERYGHTGVWTGSSMVVWGGENVSGPFSTGGRYNPLSDTWTPTSMVNAPQARSGHTSVWTGSRMIVWGGAGATSVLNTGGRYDPGTDTWSPTATFGVGRSEHTAVWTGSRMIVWGGNDDEPRVYPECSNDLNTGGVYDPIANTWSTTSTIGAPNRRTSHSAIWTGSRMIVWGGRWYHDVAAAGQCFVGSDPTTFLASGGVYDPLLDQWTSIPLTGAPLPRAFHSAVWTGDWMLIWGGGTFWLAYQDGARFGAPDPDGDGFSVCEGDCDDTRPTVHPGAPELCDGLDNDCDGPIDESADADGDGFFSACGGDCNDSNPAVHPGVAELCNGVDDDCDGSTDEGLPDGDGDGFSNCFDCLDTNGAVYPGASQICDGLNNNCNAPGWPGLAGTNERDDDQDSFSECAGDCNDASAIVYPGAPQACDGINNDCSSPTYPDIAGTNEGDDDGDSVSECSGDCDDAHAAVYQGATQFCDGLNNNCAWPGWPSLAGTNESDDDADGLSECTGDCNDASNAVYPGAPQICDGVNNNCSAPGWPGLSGTNEGDDDGDSFSECQGDCNDAVTTLYPNSPEINDGEDNQCPSNFGYGMIDEISGIAGFSSATQFSWPPQSGATAYEVQRSSRPFPAASPFAFSRATSASSWIDASSPPVGVAFFYLVRPTALHLGSWGLRSDGQERSGFVVPEALCADSADNDGDGFIDCADPDCQAASGCAAQVFSFNDTLGDDIADASLTTFFSSISAGAGDYLYLSLAVSGVADFQICAQRADFYKNSYLSLAAGGGSASSGTWSRWTRAGNSAWSAPDTGSYENAYGSNCFDAHSWCPERTLGGRQIGVLPEQTDACETVDLMASCGSGNWRLTIRVAPTRFAACGF
ncbi:MAG TPA: MopE-related protein [Candidatus Polarisedimenticolia bacterium]|nr:MopE-related protein [Candidatus Polarisedimenticolia bacterium]